MASLHEALVRQPIEDKNISMHKTDSDARRPVAADEAKRPVGWIRRIVLWLAILCLLPIVLMIVFGAIFASAKSELSALCSELKPGMPLAEVRAKVESAGYVFRSLPVGEGGSEAFVTSAGTMGRHSCKVDFATAVVQRAQMIFLD